jgi:hypothetical protein
MGGAAWVLAARNARGARINQGRACFGYQLAINWLSIGAPKFSRTSYDLIL